MRFWLLAAGVMVAAYAAFLLILIRLGKREDARALAGFIPDCIVLFKRLLSDPSTPRRNKLLLGATILYLAVPFDLVPDFIPIAGQLDDVIIVAFVLRSALQSSEDDLLQKHWPGPASTLRLIRRVTGLST